MPARRRRDEIGEGVGKALRNAAPMEGLQPVPCKRCETPYTFIARERSFHNTYHARCKKCGDTDVVITYPEDKS